MSVSIRINKKFPKKDSTPAMKFGRNINHVQLSQNLLQREATKNLRHYRLLVDNRVVDFNGYNQNTKEKTQMKTVDNLVAYKEN